MPERLALPKQKSPARAIRMMCVECMGGQSVQDAKDLIRDCPVSACPLYAFRFGRNPYHARACQTAIRGPRSGLTAGQEVSDV